MKNILDVTLREVVESVKDKTMELKEDVMEIKEVAKPCVKNGIRFSIDKTTENIEKFAGFLRKQSSKL